MKWEPFKEIRDCGVLVVDRHEDERGSFEEMWNRKEFARAGIPLPWNWAQDNMSYSLQGVLRGFHIQRNEPQGKLVTCLAGRILDVCVDVRRDSPTFMHMTRVILDHSEGKSFYLPPGTAHAFLALTDALVHYRCTTAYDKESDGGFNAFTPEAGYIWPGGQFVRSEKDLRLPTLQQWLDTPVPLA